MDGWTSDVKYLAQLLAPNKSSNGSYHNFSSNSMPFFMKTFVWKFYFIFFPVLLCFNHFIYIKPACLGPGCVFRDHWDPCGWRKVSEHVCYCMVDYHGPSWDLVKTCFFGNQGTVPCCEPTSESEPTAAAEVPALIGYLPIIQEVQATGKSDSLCLRSCLGEKHNHGQVHGTSGSDRVNESIWMGPQSVRAAVIVAISATFSPLFSRCEGGLFPHGKGCIGEAENSLRISKEQCSLFAWMWTEHAQAID